MYALRSITEVEEELSEKAWHAFVTDDGHVIRSHRRPKRHGDNRRTLIFIAAGVLALMLTTETTRSTYAAMPPTIPGNAPVVIAGALEIPVGSVEYPPTGSDAQTPYDDALRVSRSIERKAPPPMPRIDVVINYATAQVGDPYRWANAGPNAFDCSGLVKAAFRVVGIELPHFTGTMIRHGSPVNRVSLQRGDIVFPSSGHVGLYLGNNQFIHASSSRGGVVITKLYSFYAARRIAL
jgi:cell wall-associated NlpC family hydrolase